MTMDSASTLLLLVFDLPEGHDFVKFNVGCGLDNDVDNAPFGATVEFRILKG